MKICTTCKIEKSEDEFGFKNKQKGKLQARCKQCSRDHSNNYYLNSDKRKKNIRIRAKYSFDFLFALVRRYKEIIGCVKCKIKYPYYVLDFHHVGSDKDYNVSQITKHGSKERLRKEIKKCIVVCSNCHRIIHNT